MITFLLEEAEAVMDSAFFIVENNLRSVGFLFTSLIDHPLG